MVVGGRSFFLDGSIDHTQFRELFSHSTTANERKAVAFHSPEGGGMFLTYLQQCNAEHDVKNSVSFLLISQFGQVVGVRKLGQHFPISQFGQVFSIIDTPANTEGRYTLLRTPAVGFPST